MSVDNGSSASQNSQDSVSEDSTDSTQTQTAIKPEDHLRAIDDLKKFKAKSRELETKLQQLMQEQESLKEKGLTEANDFKSLYEQAKNKNAEWEARYSKMKENIAYNEKYKAAQAALINAGIRKDALKLLDKEPLDEIIVEYTSEGRTLTSGVEEYVDKFKKEFGAFAFESKGPTRVNGSGGSSSMSSDGPITAAEVYMIERKHGLTSNEYKSAVEQFKKQKNR
jgi:hypothetical protein